MNTLHEQWAARRRKLTKDIGSRVLWPLEQRLGRDSIVGDPTVVARERFPWLWYLEHNTSLIQADLENLLTQRERLPLFHELSPDQRSISRDDRWRTYFFRGFGYDSNDCQKRCPNTTEVLRNIPGLVTAFFSILAPGAHIPRHRGVFKGLLRVHLGLQVPKGDGCRMWLDGHTVQWKEGEAFVFDDTRPHEVWNDTDQERVVLLMDIVRPLRAPTAWLNQALLKAIALSPYVGEGRRNALNWERAMEAY